MATVGEAVIKLKFDSKSADAGLKNTEKTVEKGANNMGARVKKLGANIGKVLTAGFAVATAGAVAFAKSSITAFNEQEKAFAKLEQSAKNQNWAAGAVDDLKKYNSELQKVGIIGDEVAASGQAQLGTFALSGDAVKKLTPAMNDLLAATSGYNTTTDNATQMANLMGKVMTGNVGALTRYGVTLDENQKKLLAEGDEMTRAATLAEVLKQNYGGFNEKLAQTPQGQVKQLSNNFGDLKEQFGAFIAGKGDLSGFFDQLDVVIGNVLTLTTSMGPKIITGIVQLVQGIAQKLPSILQQLAPTLINAIIDLSLLFPQVLPSFIQAGLSILTAIIDGITNNVDKIVNTMVEMITKVAQIFSKPDSLQKIFNGAITLFMKIIEAMPKIIEALANALPTIIESIVQFLTDPSTLAKLIQAGFTLFIALVKAIPKILGGLISAFGSVFKALWNNVKNIFSKFAGNFGQTIGNIFKGAVNGVLGFIEGFINSPIDLINGAIDLINKLPGVNIGKMPRVSLPRLAEGGVVGRSTIAEIGENGREAVIPLQRNTDNWSGLLASTLADEFSARELNAGGGNTVYMTVQVNNEMDAQDIGRVLSRSIRRMA